MCEASSAGVLQLLMLSIEVHDIRKTFQTKRKAGAAPLVMILPPTP